MGISGGSAEEEAGKVFPLGWSRDAARETKRQRDGKDLSLAQDVSSKQGAQATKKASQGGGSTLGSSKKQESHPPLPFHPLPPRFSQAAAAAGRQFHDGIIHDWQARRGRQWGLEIVLLFQSGLGWVLLPFSPSRSKVQVHSPLPLPLRRAVSAARARPRAPGFCQGRDGCDSWGGRRRSRGGVHAGDPSHRFSWVWGGGDGGLFRFWDGRTVESCWGKRWMNGHTRWGGGVVIVSPSLSGLVSRRRRLCWFRRAGRCWDGSSWFSSLGRLGSIIAFVDRQAGVFLSLSYVCSANRSRIVPPLPCRRDRDRGCDRVPCPHLGRRGVDTVLILSALSSRPVR